MLSSSCASAFLSPTHSRYVQLQLHFRPKKTCTLFPCESTKTLSYEITKRCGISRIASSSSNLHLTTTSYPVTTINIGAFPVVCASLFLVHQYPCFVHAPPTLTLRPSSLMPHIYIGDKGDLKYKCIALSEYQCAKP